MPRMGPPALLVGSYVVRGVRLWALTRAIASMLMLFTLPDARVLHVSPAAVFYIVVLSVAVCLVDCWRHGELALIRNLGVALPFVVAVFLVPAVLGEVFLFLLARIIA